MKVADSYYNTLNSKSQELYRLYLRRDIWYNDSYFIEREEIILNIIRDLPIGGAIVIVLILALFCLAVALLLIVNSRYRTLGRKVSEGDTKDDFLSAVLKTYADAYRKYGRDTNTPAIITDAIATKLRFLLLGERFLNNAVSLFVTLGLFGTFLGLSMSVSSLTELISYSNSSEWLSVLDSVGSGLMSSLGGMGVAFYTSLVGAGCSILLTILRTILNPQAEREKLETSIELWLDTSIAPDLRTTAAKDDAEMLHDVVEALYHASDAFQENIDKAAKSFNDSTRTCVMGLAKSAELSNNAQTKFADSIARFNDGVHDFSEVDYNLRGSIERMDLAVRDLSAALREINRRIGGKSE